MASSVELIASRYGKSLADVMSESSVLAMQAMYRELMSWKTFLSKDVLAFFLSPLFDPSEKTSVLGEIFQKEQSTPELKSFVSLLVQNNHIALLPLICESYDKEMQKKKNETVAFVKTAFPLLPEEQSRLKTHLNNLTKKEVLLKISEEPALIGGIQVEVEGALYDSSISGYLNRLKQEFAV